MVAVGQIEPVEAAKYITLSPQPPGQWQWAGTQTLLFVPKGDHLPQATNYTVTIPDTVTSADGTKLNKTMSWNIKTPAAKVTRFYPDSQSGAAQDTTPSMVAFFNQAVDPKVVLKYITLQVNQRPYAIRLVDHTGLKKKEEPYKSLKTTASSRDWVAFTPVTPLPKDCTATVTFAEDLPSAEGPLADSREQEHQVKIYGPLRLLDRKINGRAATGKEYWSRMEEGNATFEFSNTIDFPTFRSSMVSVEPAVDNLKIKCTNNQITLTGLFEPFSQYTVKFSDEIKDKFGQALAPDSIGMIQTESLSPFLTQDKEFLSLVPGEPITPSFWAQGALAVRVTVRRVAPEDWTDFNRGHRQKMQKTLGVLLSSKDYIIGTKGRQVNLDLSHYLEGKYGHLLVEEELLGIKKDPKDAINCWIQVTDLALDSFGQGQIIVRASKLADGKPLEGVDLSLAATKVKTKSDKDGLATIELPYDRLPFCTLIGRKGEDSCILTETNFQHFLHESGPLNQWYAVSDRNLYRPGEKAYIKGWLRTATAIKGEKWALPACLSVSYRLIDQKQNTILEGDARVDSHGGFAFEVALPKQLQLGKAYVQIMPSTDKARPTFSNWTHVELDIQEFRRAEFEMAVNSSKGDSLLLGESTLLSTETNYLAGGVLANSPVTWTVNYTPTNFRPPGWPYYQFQSNHDSLWYAYRYPKLTTQKTITSKTDSSGRKAVSLNFDGMSHPTPMTCQCEATVTDLNRQAWSKKLELLVHPAELYVGIKQNQREFRQNAPLNLSLVATNLDGKIQPGTKIELDLTEVDKTGATIKSSHKLITLTDKAENITYQPGNTASSVNFEARARDSKNRLNQVTGLISMEEPTAQSLPAYQPPMKLQDSCNLTADKTNYKPGDIAQLKIQTSVYPSTGVLLITQGATSSAVSLIVDSPEKTVKIPISEEHYPSFGVVVFLAKDSKTFCTARRTIIVPPTERRLVLTAQPAEAFVIPGQETKINLELKDQGGKPVGGGQIALAAVDEAVLALNNYKFEDPMRAFYGNHFHFVECRHSREMDTGVLITVFNSRIITGMIGESVDSETKATHPPAFLPGILRQNFSTLALFSPAIETDANGKAQVKFKMPDSIARYRIMAIAAAGTNKFGATESSITAQLPLAIKPSPPRFLSFGDRCELPVLLQNLTDKPLRAEVAIRADNATVSDPGKTVTIPANDRVEVRFATTATGLGQAHFQCAAAAGSLSDAAQFSLPVLIPSSSETYVASGVIDGRASEAGVVQKLTKPQNVFDKLGGLTFSTSSSAVQSLTGAYAYLRDYPYTCSEQISSRLIAMLTLQDRLAAFGQLKGEEKERFEQCIQSDINLLEKRQKSNGGFGLWSANEKGNWPFVSLQATHALNMAQAKHYSVAEQRVREANAHLKNIEEEIPAEYDERTKLAIAVRALNVRHLANDDDVKAAKALFARATKNKNATADASNLSIEAAAWLLPILSKNKACEAEAEALRKLINSSIIETTSTASAYDFGYDNWNYCVFSSPSRTEAATLEALIDDQPQSPLIPKLVKGLQQRSKNSIWVGTQENSYVLQALDKYFSAYEKETPDFQAHAWLNDTLIANQKFAGRTTESRSVTVPMPYLLSHPCDQVQIDKTGPGRLYYRLALDYVPKSLNQTALNRGFTVERTYEPIDAASEVRQDDHGVWHFKAGARVRVKVRFSTPGTKYHVAMMDPIPAGAEPINSHLLGTRTMLPESTNSAEDPTKDDKPWHSQNWSEHENLRDHQAEAFTSLLPAGHYEYTYTMMATTPGHYAVPPTKVEEMYSSESFGRAKAETVIVE